MGRSVRWKQRRSNLTADDVDDAGGGYSSLRAAYEKVGPSQFYAAHGCEYSNPHADLLDRALVQAFSAFDSAGALGPREGGVWRALDLACGGGEATLALSRWWEHSRGGGACDDDDGGGDGKRKKKRRRGAALEIDACDPYTADRYAQKTGGRAEPWSFDDVARGALETRQPYDLTLASFCLHLLDEEALRATLGALARRSRLLCVASPFKKPAIDEASTGWRRVGPEVVEHNQTNEGATRHRVRVRLYQSSQCKAAEST